MDILIKLGLIAFWFIAIVAAASAFVYGIAWLARRQIISGGGAKVIYFCGFLAAATYAYHLV
ncbi:hypothetical protein ACRARH_20820 [Phytobacter ursingii]